MPLEWLRWHLAERFGWTLAEVDALSVADVRQYLAVEDGRAKAGRRGATDSESIR